MAALYYDIRWLPDGPVEQFAGTSSDFYVLGETDLLDLNAVPIYCHNCGDIALGENIPTLDKIDRDIRDLHVPGTDLYHLTHADMSAEFAAGQLGKLLRRRSWRATRKTPAKCIGCGSPNIVALSVDEPVRTPLGTFELWAVGFCRLSEEEDRFYTGEGVRIRPVIRRDWHRAVLGPFRWLRAKAINVGSGRRNGPCDSNAARCPAGR